MNCCDDWGNCTRGPACPARANCAGHSAAPRITRLCADLGVCNLHPACADYAACCQALELVTQPPSEDEPMLRASTCQNYLAGCLLAAVCAAAGFALGCWWLQVPAWLWR